ncbi:unannotated protein [freshwater metagenome]|uniref:Unannotated protein n=1 Tax=freshwater metagenome TaxID=449393 RepID=A0A6J7MP28_9ZZZZ
MFSAIESVSTIVAGASGENAGATTISVGKRKSTPNACARLINSRTAGIDSFSNKDFPTDLP